MQAQIQEAASVPTPQIDLRAAVDYLSGRQTPLGGFCFYRDWGVEEPSAADTFHALAALALLGAPPRDGAGARGWLQDLQDNSGRYPDIATAWYATEGLARVQARPRRDPTHWLAAQAGFLFGEPSRGRRPDAVLLEAARYFELCRRFRVALESRHREATARVLRTLQDPSGPFPRGAPTLVADAVALRLAAAAALMPDRRLLDHVHACEDRLYGFRALPSGRSTHLEVLAAGCAVLRHFGAPLRYAPALRRTVAACQSRGGGFGRQIGAIPTLRATWHAVTILHMLDANDPRSS